MITKIEIKTIDIQDCKYDIELFNVLTKELQNEQVTGYYLSPNKIVVHVVNEHAEFGITVETPGVFHNVEGIYNQFLRDFPNVLLETIPVGDFAVEIAHSELTEKFTFSDADLESLQKMSDDVLLQSTAQIEKIIAAFEEIENGVYVAKEPDAINTDYYKNSQEKSIDQMKDILTGFYSTTEDSTELLNAIAPMSTMEMSSDGTITVTAPSITVSAEEETELSAEDIHFLTKIQKTKEMVDIEVATISTVEFDSYAAKHHIIGWEVQSSATVNVKFIEGTTPESTIKKFHDMIESSNTSNSPFSIFNWEKDFAESVKFLSSLREVLDDDTNVVDEFINRVKKHNIFVRESIAKIRAALIDMEKDYESLSHEVNLSIDWDKLTAFATKKERIEHRLNGVEMLFGNTDKVPNVVKIEAQFARDEFYLPVHLLTDEIREKYSYSNELLYIEDVVDFAFYQQHLNGHFIIIEKTDL